MNASSNNPCNNDGTTSILELWEIIYENAQAITDPIILDLVTPLILEKKCLGEALSSQLAKKLTSEQIGYDQLFPLFREVYKQGSSPLKSVVSDIMAICDRDPACKSPLDALLFFKGFLAVTTHRVAHYFWHNNRQHLALYLQSRNSEVFAVDIHPAAQIGCGLLLDHATSIVIGETAIIEDCVSLLHEVTLGGTGKESGNRHPIIRRGVLIGAGAKILGRVEIGTGSKVGAGSVVLEDVDPHVTVAGVPARVITQAKLSNVPAEDMNQCI